MDIASLPAEWQDAFRRDLVQTPTLPDPLPERRLARLLAAWIITGLFFMVLPGTLLGVWNLIGISSQRQLAAVSPAWIQAHGHAHFFGWVGTFIIGISLYTLPKCRGATTRSVPVAWAMWAAWTLAIGLRWYAGVLGGLPMVEFRVSAVLEFAVSLALLWQVTAKGPKYNRGQPWEAPVFSRLIALAVLFASQVYLSFVTLKSSALPKAENRTLVSVAVWTFAFLSVVGYSAKFFGGLVGSLKADRTGLRITVVLAVIAAAGFVLDWPALQASSTVAATVLACWSLRLFHAPSGKAKTTGVYKRFPLFARLSYVWLVPSALLGWGVVQPGMLGASRHAFTVGFLAALIFSIGPRILPSFLNSRELWSARLMQMSLLLLTAGCALRVISEPLAYGNVVGAAWKVLPVSALAELVAVILFASNLAIAMATPIPSWFGRKHVNDRMSVYWLVSSYPAARPLLIASGLVTLARVKSVPKSLTVREAAQADRVSPDVLIDKLEDFFETRLPRSLQHKER